MPKVDFAVEDDVLICDTSEGQIRIPIDLPMDTMLSLAQLQDEGANEIAVFQKAMSDGSVEVLESVRALKSGREGIRIIKRWAEEFQRVIDADMGESSGSSD